MDLAERLEALQALNERPLPSQEPSYTDDEAKDVFLSALEEGRTVPEAAKAAGRTSSWFRRRRNPKARTYDVDFSNHFDEIMVSGGPNQEGLALRAFTALVKACEEGNVRAAEKILGAYHPDFGFLRPQITNGTWNVDQLQVFFGELPLSKLLELKEARERERMKELDVIDL